MSVLADLSQTAVADARAILLELLQEQYPDIDFRGVVGDIVLELAAVLQAHNRQQIDTALRSASLLAISADPTLADDDTVDRVLSNYRISRKTGTAATGMITIVLSQQAAVTVGAQTEFTANGQTFRTTTSYTARLSDAAVTSPTDKLLTARGDGTYGFTIPVTATTVGTAGMLTRGTTLTVTTAFQYLVRVYAANDFVDGTNTETNADLLAALAAGMSVKAWSNRVSIDAMLRSQDAFSRILQTSIVGFGDVEMTRDQRSIFPISTGGRADLYVRTQVLPQTTQLEKTATLVDTTAAGGIWQIEIAKDEAPGLYDVTWIARAVDGDAAEGYEITADVRGRDLTALSSSDTYLPDIASDFEAIYTAYQTVIVQFLDTDTETTNLTVGESTQTYQIAVRAFPLLADIQEYVNRRDVRPPQCDVVVRAPIPCFLALNFSLITTAAAASPDQVAVKQAIADRVNSLGFAGELYATQLSDAIYDVVDADVRVSRIDMVGQLRKPDGTTTRLRSFDVLRIPQSASMFTSGRTAVFILDQNDIDITVAATSVPEV